MRMRLAVGVLCAVATAAALSVDGRSVISALTIPQCDFMTGAGYINPQPAMGNKATFAIAGWCRPGSFGGHLQFQDKTVYKKIHSVSITGYKKADDDDKARMICGHGKSDHDEDVDFVVRTKDGGGWGYGDEFDIQLTNATGALLYTTFGGAHHSVHGGNTERHKHRSSDDDDFGGRCPPIVTTTLSVMLTSVPGSTGFPGGSVTSNVGGINCTVPHSSTVAPTQTGTCSAPISNTTVILTAQAQDSNGIATFVGCDSQSTPPAATATCTVMMGTTSRQVSVSFSLLE